MYAPGLYRFRLVAEYHDDYTELRKDNEYKYTGLTPASEYEGILDDGYALIGEVLDFPVEFRAGDVTSLKGDVSELSDAAEDFDTLRFGVYVATTGTSTVKYWTSLAEAIQYCADLKLTTSAWTGENVVKVLCDVEDGGYADLRRTDLTADTFVMVNLQKHYVKNLRVEQGTETYRTRVCIGAAGVHYDCEVLNMHINSYIPVEQTTANKFKTYADLVMLGNYAATETWFEAWPAGSPDSMYISGVYGDLTCIGITYVSGGTVVKGKLASASGANITLGENVTVAGIGCNNVHGMTDTVANGLKSTWKGCKTTVIARNENGYVGDYTDSVINTNASTQTAFKRIGFDANCEIIGTKYTYGINGCKITLPANTYTKTSARVLYWNTVASPTDTTPGVEYADEATYTVGSTSPQTLYAQWSLPVGGRIYYVHQGVNDAAYTFYKSNGDVITYTGIPTADTLADAVSYSVHGKTADMNDMFFVMDSTNYNVTVASTPIQYGANGTALGASVNIFGYVGGGKGVYKLAMANPAFWNGTGGASDWNTIWSYVRYLNGLSTNTSAAYSGKTKLPGACNDWYIPTVNDLIQLGLWCGYLAYDSSAVSYDSGDTTSVLYSKYRKNASATKPSDSVKGTVWDMFTSNFFFSCNEWYTDAGANMIEWSRPNYFTKCGKTAGSMTCFAIRSF